MFSVYIMQPREARDFTGDKISPLCVQTTTARRLAENVSRRADLTFSSNRLGSVILSRDGEEEIISRDRANGVRLSVTVINAHARAA